MVEGSLSHRCRRLARLKTGVWLVALIACGGTTDVEPNPDGGGGGAGALGLGGENGAQAGAGGEGPCTDEKIGALAPEAELTFDDGTFVGPEWSRLGWIRDIAESDRSSQVDEGGNPGAFRRVRIDRTRVEPSPEPGMITIHIKDGAFYVPSDSGPVATLDYGEDAIAFTGDQQTGAALCQRQLCYVAPVAFIGNFNEWRHLERSGLAEDDFVLVDATLPSGLDETRHPNFSETGRAMAFGFFRVVRSVAGQEIPSIEHDGGIDNWTMRVNQAPAPAPPCQ